jgi:hypothetical protein
MNKIPGRKPSITKSNLEKIDNSELVKALSAIIEANQLNLLGEYDFYTIYRKENKETYALIYAFYSESNGIFYDEMDEITNKDAKYMHDLISELELDYLFIVPYYDYTDREKGSIMTGAVVTNEF